MGLISENQIVLDCKLSNKEEVISLLADLMCEMNKIYDKDGLIHDIYEREKIANTAMGHDIAIPHALSTSVKEAGLVFIRLMDSIAWNSTDQVKYIFGIVVPKENKNNQHLKILSTLARNLMDQNFTDKLFSSASKADCYKILTEIGI